MTTQPQFMAMPSLNNIGNASTAMLTNPRNWYWQVASNADGIYSSKTNTYVDPGDADYVAWLGDGLRAPIPIPDEVVLWGVIKPNIPQMPDWLFNGVTFAQPAVGEYTKEQLADYAGDVRWQAEITGTSGGTAYRSDRLSRALMSTTLGYVRANAALTVEWKALDGTFSTLSATQMETVNSDINAHVEQCYAAEKTTKADIDAGTITTLEQIDAVFAPLRKLEWNESYRKEL
jgi:Domain of unknown function (DUF4376)